MSSAACSNSTRRENDSSMVLRPSHRRTSIQNAAQQCPSRPPIASDRTFRQTQKRCNRDKVETGEKMQFHYVRKTWLAHGETFQRPVQREQLRRCDRSWQVAIERLPNLRRTALLCIALSCRIDQNVSHRARGKSEEVRAVIDGEFRIRQLQPGFVDQRGRRQGCVRTARPAVRPTSQIIMDQSEKLIVRAGITGCVSLQQPACLLISADTHAHPRPCIGRCRFWLGLCRIQIKSRLFAHAGQTPAVTFALGLFIAV